MVRSYIHTRVQALNLADPTHQSPLRKFGVVHAARRHEDDPRVAIIGGTAPQARLYREKQHRHIKNEDNDSTHALKMNRTLQKGVTPLPQPRT